MRDLQVTVLLVLIVALGCSVGAANKFGCGLVDSGSPAEFSRIRELGGDGAWVLVIFAGFDRDLHSALPSWVTALNSAYASNLNVVVRIGPSWDSRNYREMSDDANHLVYTTLSGAIRDTVSTLPLPPGNLPLLLHLDNEVNLCSEWQCNGGGILNSSVAAQEYANLYVQVYDAIRSLGQPRYLLAPAPLAPGGCVWCQCCGSDSCQFQPGETGLQFMQHMRAAVPNVFAKMDFLASHSYPATNIGYGFNVPFQQGRPGLEYYKLELDLIGRALPVVIAETGWAVNEAPNPSQQDKAFGTVSAYQEIWLSDGNVTAVTPFILADPQWGDKLGFGYLTADLSSTYPVFDSVKQLRCSMHEGNNYDC